MVLKGCTKLRYVHQDHLSGTAVITDANGNEVGSIKYYPYGETRSTSGTLETDKKFTGQRLDDTGLYYYNARYYDPTIGRFISADTLVPGPANPQAFNRYSYCLNNPLKYTDPSGHFGVISSIKFAIGMTKLYVSQGAKALTNPSNIQKVLKKAVLPSPKKTASTVERPNNTFNREAIGPSPDTPGTVTDMGKNLPVSSYDDYESPSVVEQIPGYLIKPGAKIMRYGGNVIAVGGLPLLTNPASWGIGYAGSVIGNIGVTMDQYSDALISGEKTRYGEGQDLTDMLNPVGIDRYKVDVEDPLTKLGDAPVYIADTLSDIVSDITSGTADIFK